MLTPFENREKLLGSLRNAFLIWTSEENAEVNFHKLTAIYVLPDRSLSKTRETRTTLQRAISELILGVDGEPCFVDFVVGHRTAAKGFVVLLSRKNENPLYR
jgi:hypothetical protein